LSKQEGHSKNSGKANSRIRRVSADEKEGHRRWPDKKHRASEVDIPLPKPGEKNKIYSILTALPVLMLMIGLAVYFRGESKQNNGDYIEAEMIKREAAFKSFSEVSGIGKAKHYLWYTSEGNSRGVRISADQKHILASLAEGDELSLELTPRVAGSTTLWVFRILQDDEVLLSSQ